jgi:hypothetical protein
MTSNAAAGDRILGQPAISRGSGRGERCDADARFDELFPAYQALEAK